MNLEFSSLHHWPDGLVLPFQLNIPIMLHSFQRPGQITRLAASSISKLCQISVKRPRLLVLIRWALSNPKSLFP